MLKAASVTWLLGACLRMALEVRRFDKFLSGHLESRDTTRSTKSRKASEEQMEWEGSGKSVAEVLQVMISAQYARGMEGKSYLKTHTHNAATKGRKCLTNIIVKKTERLSLSTRTYSPGTALGMTKEGSRSNLWNSQTTGIPTQPTGQERQVAALGRNRKIPSA